jgi:hypothetical protein
VLTQKFKRLIKNSSIWVQIYDLKSSKKSLKCRESVTLAEIIEWMQIVLDQRNTVIYWIHQGAKKS